MTDEAEDATTPPGGAGPGGLPHPRPDGLRTGDAIQADDIATLFGANLEGVATFKAFVSEEFTRSTDTSRVLRRLYTDDSALEWVEVLSHDILAQMPVGPDPTDPRSLVFVERDALVTTCRAGYASQINDEGSAVDPRGGPNPRRTRRPPY